MRSRFYGLLAAAVIAIGTACAPTIPGCSDDDVQKLLTEILTSARAKDTEATQAMSFGTADVTSQLAVENIVTTETAERVVSCEATQTAVMNITPKVTDEIKAQLASSDSASAALLRSALEPQSVADTVQVKYTVRVTDDGRLLVEAK